MSTLQRAVVWRGMLLLVGTTLAIGAATAGLLHWTVSRQQDAALIVAANGAAADGHWTIDHAPPPVRVRVVDNAVGELERRRVELALHTEAPQFFDRGSERGVLAVVEREGDDGEEHRVVEAVVERRGLASNAGPFLLVYLPLAGVSWLAAWGALSLLVRRAMAPLDAVRNQMETIRRPNAGQRLDPSGPAEVRALGAAFNALLDRLDAAHRAQERFTSEAAHELRTPVTSMLLVLELARRHNRTPPQRDQDLVALEDSARRLHAMVEGLLVLARVDQGVEVAPQVCAVGDLVRTCLDEAPHADLSALGAERVVVRPELAAIALRNLLRNAARHAGGAKVVVRSRTVGERVHLEVEDRGAGVAEADRERVFDTLTRGAQARAHDPDGLGLGLPLARRIARGEGGDCFFEGTEHGGARAVLAFPAP